MKLLLDEHFPPALARELRTRGHDAVAVKERPELHGLPDLDLFAVAIAESRALVTENVRDFMPIHVRLQQEERGHAGVVFTSNRRFPRGRAATIGALVRALDALPGEFPADPPPGWIWWL